MKRVKHILPVVTMLVAGTALLLNSCNTSFAKDNTEDLKKQIEALQKRVDELEAEKHFAQSVHPGIFNRRRVQQWDPFEEMKRMQQQFNNIFNESFIRGMESRGFNAGFQGSFFEPDVDIWKGKDHYIAKIDLPGMDKDKINIEVKDKMLMVSGERETFTAEKEGDKFLRQERSYGHFLKAFPLPEDAKENGISAEYKNGVLIIKIPRAISKNKKEEAKKIKVI